MRSRKHNANRLDEDGDWIADQPKRRPPRTHSYSDRRHVTPRSTPHADRDVSRTSQVAGDTVVNATATPRRPQSDVRESATGSRSTHRPAVDGLTRTPVKAATKVVPARPPTKTPIKTASKSPVKTPIKSPVKTPLSTKPPDADAVSPRAVLVADKTAAVIVNGTDADLSPTDSVRRETDKKKQLQVI